LAVALLTASCAAVGAGNQPNSTSGADRAAAAAPLTKAQKKLKQRKQRRQEKRALLRAQAARLDKVPGLNVLLNSSGMTISWLAVDNATQGYDVAVDGQWRRVRKTKVHYDQLLPGLRYQVQVAAVGDAGRGPVAVSYFDPERGAEPPVVMTAQPSPTPTVIPPPPPLPTPPPLSSPPAPPAAEASAEETVPAPDDPAEEVVPIAAEELLPDIVEARADGCGFGAGGRVNLRVTIVLAGNDALTPTMLTDDSGRLYVAHAAYRPESHPGSTAEVYIPVGSGKPPAHAAIDRAVFQTGRAASGAASRSIGPVTWGYEECTPVPAKPAW
jgi:hypothetical protein